MSEITYDRRYPIEQTGEGWDRVKYGPWTIYYDPPPIPAREFDWHYIHEDYDASWEGEEDGFVSNGLDGCAPTLDAAMDAIDELEDEQ